MVIKITVANLFHASNFFCFLFENYWQIWKVICQGRVFHRGLQAPRNNKSTRPLSFVSPCLGPVMKLSPSFLVYYVQIGQHGSPSDRALSFFWNYFPDDVEVYLRQKVELRKTTKPKQFNTSSSRRKKLREIFAKQKTVSTVILHLVTLGEVQPHSELTNCNAVFRENHKPCTWLVKFSRYSVKPRQTLWIVAKLLVPII